ncbi:MAG: hypothetical protein V4507_02485 [Verrucomicrobiota bacterium]
MDPFKKSLFLFGFLIPLALTLIFSMGMITIRGEIKREFNRKRIVFDEMKREEIALKKGEQDRAILVTELPKLRSYFQPINMIQATAKIASECSDEKGIKLGDLKESGSVSSTKSYSHQIKLLARSSSLIDVLGDVQITYPALQLDQWSLSVQSDQKILLFQGTLNIAATP